MNVVDHVWQQFRIELEYWCIHKTACKMTVFSSYSRWLCRSDTSVPTVKHYRTCLVHCISQAQVVCGWSKYWSRLLHTCKRRPRVLVSSSLPIQSAQPNEYSFSDCAYSHFLFRISTAEILHVLAISCHMQSPTRSDW